MIKNQRKDPYTFGKIFTCNCYAFVCMIRTPRVFTFLTTTNVSNELVGHQVVEGKCSVLVFRLFLVTIALIVVDLDLCPIVVKEQDHGYPPSDSTRFTSDTLYCSRIGGWWRHPCFQGE